MPCLLKYLSQKLFLHRGPWTCSSHGCIQVSYEGFCHLDIWTLHWQLKTRLICQMGLSTLTVQCFVKYLHTANIKLLASVPVNILFITSPVTHILRSIFSVSWRNSCEGSVLCSRKHKEDKYTHSMRSWTAYMGTEMKGIHMKETWILHKQFMSP